MLWYGGYLVYHLRLQAGTLISIMLYTLNLAMAFAFLSNLYGEFMQVSLPGARYIKTSLLSSLLQCTKYLLPMTSEWDQLVAWVGDHVLECVLCMGQCSVYYLFLSYARRLLVPQFASLNSWIESVRFKMEKRPLNLSKEVSHKKLG